MFEGIDMAGVGVYNAAVTWEFARRLRELTRMKLVLNLVLGLQRAILAEGLEFARRGGVDPP